MTRFFQLLLLLLVTSLTGAAQKLATLNVVTDKSSSGLAIPASVSLDAITHLPDSSIELIQIQGPRHIPVPFQIDRSQRDRRLTWLVPDQKNPRYELVVRATHAQSSPQIRATNQDGTLTLSDGTQNLLRYQLETLMPPPGINEVFKRSGFIHPIWSPKGRVLTRIQPPDHYHHYGLWNPWTHVLFEGDTVDFWNLNARQGTVRFENLLSVVTGNVFGEYAAVHDHIAFNEGRERVAIREIQTVRLYAQPGQDYYIADITISMNCPEAPARLLEYRYGGLGWRATEQWTKENSRVLTSEGKTRKEADGSTARWVIVEGTVDGTNAGILMMSHPGNYNHPEPLRIWPENSNRNRGDMFANFSPTKNMDWPLEIGKNYVLRYRLIVFDGDFTRERAEVAWRNFSSPPLVKIAK